MEYHAILSWDDWKRAHINTASEDQPETDAPHFTFIEDK